MEEDTVAQISEAHAHIVFLRKTLIKAFGLKA